MDADHRGVSSVVGILLMVAIVVILAAIISVVAFGVEDRLHEPAPNVAQTSGEFTPGADEQEVRVTHLAGDSVTVANIEVIVRASGPNLDTETRLVNLPAEGSDLDAENIQGDAGLISEGFGDAGPADPNQVIIEEYPADDNIWSAGDTIQFEINVGGADFRDPPVSGPKAEELEVIIVHTPSNAIIFEDTFVP